MGNNQAVPKPNSTPSNTGFGGYQGTSTTSNTVVTQSKSTAPYISSVQYQRTSATPNTVVTQSKSTLATTSSGGYQRTSTTPSLATQSKSTVSNISSGGYRGTSTTPSLATQSKSTAPYISSVQYQRTSATPNTMVTQSKPTLATTSSGGYQQTSTLSLATQSKSTVPYISSVEYQRTSAIPNTVVTQSKSTLATTSSGGYQRTSTTPSLATQSKSTAPYISSVQYQRTSATPNTVLIQPKSAVPNIGFEGYQQTTIMSNTSGTQPTSSASTSFGRNNNNERGRNNYGPGNNEGRNNNGPRNSNNEGRNNKGGRYNNHRGRNNNDGRSNNNRSNINDQRNNPWQDQWYEQSKMDSNIRNQLQTNQRNLPNRQGDQRNRFPPYHLPDTERRNNRSRPLGFKKLEEISGSEPIQILQFFSDSNNFEVFTKNDLKPDFIVLLLKCLCEMCRAEFDVLKSQTLVRICKSPYLQVLKNYIMSLHHTKIVEKKNNMYFWNDIDGFFEKLLVFCSTIIELSPGTAVDEFKTLFDILRLSIGGLQTNQKETLDDNVLEAFEELQLKFTITLEEEEKRAELPISKTVDNSSEVKRNRHLETPPDDFREIPLLPTKRDLFNKPHFLRPNMIEGAYQSVEDYLDVQFRLMREDYIGPLRDAITEYTKDDRKGRRRYGSAKFYRNVKILNFCDPKNGSGIEICYDEKLYFKMQRKKGNEKVRREKSSKRFLYGSLLLLTKGSFDDVLFCTIVDSDGASCGVITASLDIEHFSEELFKHNYLMIESDVYFPPYMHIMEMLKRPALAQSFPFEEYIIHAKAMQKPPKYLTEQAISMTLFNNRQVRNGVWPSADNLGLDESQYNAYKMALTKEFVIIQGPPGTGKTFIGLKVAQTLLKNLYKVEEYDLMDDEFIKKENLPPILVVCYTNHALDQFLEGLLPFTERLVRVGGQSKNETLKQFNLNSKRSFLNKAFYEHRDKVQETSSKIGLCRQKLDAMNNPMEIYDVTQEYPTLISNKFFAKFGMPDMTVPPLINWLTMMDRMSMVPIHQNFQSLHLNPEEDMSDEDVDEEDSDEDEFIDDVHRQRIDFDDDLGIETSVPCNVRSFNIREFRKNAFEKEKIITESLKQGQDLRIIQSERRGNAQRFNMANILEARLKRGNVGYTAAVPVLPGDVGENYNEEQRWALYWMWYNEVKEKYTKSLNHSMKIMNREKNICDELKQVGQLKSLKVADVVGVTTSGAARLQSLLRSLKSPIVIVEEAAEVMETHVIVSLTDSCQHLIMIGDHQQLRPITASYTLAKHYNLDISLFERMVKNGNHCLQLTVQHRMRPEISKLITPAIYPELRDHPCVQNYPHVLGVRKDLFFIHHTVHEKKEEDSVSRSNIHEAQFCLSLAKYLVQQGYEPSEITILATYSGQMFLMREERRNTSLLKNVHIMVLDNYQGEENEIIILSLVRSNEEGNIGFLSAVNRVCVALSRAKRGFYIIGNMSILRKRSPLWDEVYNVLDSQQSFGENLELQCQIHRDVITPVKCAEDFIKVAEGGCQSNCNRLMKCGHYCKKLCHVYDREHERYTCMEKCEKIICDLDHKCQDLCFKECRCMIIVERTLSCGHVHKLSCSTDYLKVKCDILVDDVLPICDHKVKRPCYMKVDEVVCPEPCEDRLPCGHACRKRCHKKPHMDPEHLKYVCMMDCANLNKGCTLNHTCLKRCHEECSACTVKVDKKKNCGHTLKIDCHVNVEEVVCPGKCKRSLPCGHHCKMMCKDTCDPFKCLVQVKKLRQSCGHEVDTTCGKDPETVVCRHPCNKTMSCGHKCKDLCYMKCNTDKCNEMLTNTYQSMCGHTYKIPCKDSRMDPSVGRVLTMKYCNEPCHAVLKGCEHNCKGTCGKCWAGTLHVPCAEPCGNILVCGHICKDPCRLACPPCKVKCEVKCKHSKCPKTCGIPCPTCKEPCQRSCPHGRCNKKCGEECSIPPCSEACHKTLRCGHPCRGLCGEQCPDVCKVCKPDDYPEIFFGEEDEEDARFIKLVDCPHVVEVGGMDTWIQGDTEGMIRVGECPHCKSRVINTPRYADRMKKVQRDIQAAKRQVFGEPKGIVTRMLNIQEQLNSLKQESKLHTFLGWQKHTAWLETNIKRNLAPVNNKQNRHNAVTVCLTDVNTFQTQLDVLQQISDIIKEPKTLSCSYVQYFLERLLDSLKLCTNKVSDQQSNDFNQQLNKLNMLTLVCEIEFRPDFEYSSKESKQKLNQIKDEIFYSVEPFGEDVARKYKEKLNIIRKSVGMSPVTDQERKMIVAAMGFKQGHWYTCPNGHPYCIADCGGAMVVSKCPQCGQAIGGTSHRLLGTNRVATFMDGARHSAWPGNYNIQDYAL